MASPAPAVPLDPVAEAECWAVCFAAPYSPDDPSIELLFVLFLSVDPSFSLALVLGLGGRKSP
jgi:hypothetical protein